MGRVAKKAPETPKASAEELSTVTQTRARRTPKPNPKYANEPAAATPKLESSESNGSTDIEDKLPESKIVKSTRKVISKVPEDAKSAKLTPAKAKAAAAAVKKQRIEFDDDEKTKDADEVPISSPTPPPVRATRSVKADIKEEKGEIKVGDESVAIIDVSSIIAKGPAKQDSPKIQAATPPVARATTRKRQAAELVEIKDDSPKKKKEEEKPSLITSRKSYMPANKKEVKSEELKAEEAELKKEPSSPISTIKTRRNANTPQVVDTKKPKLEEVKIEQQQQQQQKTTIASTTIMKTVVEPKKLPVMKKEAITKVAPIAASPTLPTKARIINNVVLSPQKTASALPAPRVLNSMVTPKGARLSPNVKLASSDGNDKKVFSIEMSDGSLIEKKQITSPIKTTPSAVKENVAIAPKPQPSMLLKNKLESELNRMKASANLMKRQMITPQIRQSPASHAQAGARRVTKFESWYVIDVKGHDYTAPIRHTHSHSLIRIGNMIKEILLPSTKWDYKVTLQKKQLKRQNNNDEDADEIYTGDVDKAIEADRHNLEPTSILFKRSYRDSNKNIIDRSLMLKQNSYAITMNGKQCQLVGAPDDIKSLEDLEILLQIIDSSSANHSCVESSS
jgi:hypothetical protein